MKARLVPLGGGDAIDLAREISVVGRKEDCDLRVDHKSVSKQHCILVITDGLVLVRDLGSTNGTRVNGQRVRRAALVPNDIVAFASVRYKVAFGKEAPAADPMAMTQHLDPRELDLLRKTAPHDEPEVDAPRVEVHTEDLPDVYPEDVKGPDS